MEQDGTPASHACSKHWAGERAQEGVNINERECLHVLTKYFLSTYYVSDFIPGSGDTTVNKTDKSICSHEASFTDVSYIRKIPSDTAPAKSLYKVKELM